MSVTGRQRVLKAALKTDIFKRGQEGVWRNRKQGVLSFLVLLFFSSFIF